MRVILSVVFAFLIVAPAGAADWLSLPQSWKDLQPKRAQPLPPANPVAVPIPAHRVMPTPAKDAEAIRVAPGSSHVVTLDRDAASVVVASPAHASVFLDNPRTVVIVPRAPGATGFRALDADGRTILNKQIVVGEADAESYVRVTRICDANAGGACQPVSLYYCPDNCVSVSVPSVDPNATMPVAPSVSATRVN